MCGTSKVKTLPNKEDECHRKKEQTGRVPISYSTLWSFLVQTWNRGGHHRSLEPGKTRTKKLAFHFYYSHEYNMWTSAAIYYDINSTNRLSTIRELFTSV